MKITFFGGARTVTGSCYGVETREGRVLVDCGLFQGTRALEGRNRKISLYRPQGTDGVVLTHAHIDHSGLLPAYVKAGYRGPIYSTPATHDLCEIMLMDSAHIQEMEAEWQTRKNQRSGQKRLDPLYTQSDVRQTLSQFQAIPYRERQQIAPGVYVRFQDAGHILGSASVEMWVSEDTQTTKLVFSGDVGRMNQPLIQNPQPIEEAEVVFLESTYGERLHRTEEDTLAEFLSIILKAVSDKAKVVIPAFALGRTQEVLYVLHELHRKGDLPDIPVYVDSPLAIAATEIFRKHPECFDGQARALVRRGDQPLSLPRLIFSRTVEESRAINDTDGPAIVIAASGMCNAGRIKHHLKHNLWRPQAHIVFIGFQAQGTTGRLIVDGAKRVKIFREWVAVRARIHTLGGFSAHADRDELLKWIGNLRNKDATVFVTHGEEPSALAMAKALSEHGFSDVRTPHLLDSVDLGEIPPARKEQPVEAPEPTQTLMDLERAIRKLRKRIARTQPVSEEFDRALTQKSADMELIVEEIQSALEAARSAK